MDSKPIVTLPRSLIELCHEHGQETVEGYRRGDNAASLAVSSHGAERNPQLQALAKMGECAFCVWHDLDPLKALNWSGKCDSGFDIEIHGVKFDIKTTSLNGRFLIWPLRKNHFFWKEPFDVLALIKVDGVQCQLAGWTTKGMFFHKKRVSPERPGHVLTKDTWFIEDRDLHPFRRPDIWGSR